MLFKTKPRIIVNDASVVPVKFYNALDAEVLVFNADHKADIGGFARILKAELQAESFNEASSPAVAEEHDYTFGAAVVKGDAINVSIDFKYPEYADYQPHAKKFNFYYKATANHTAAELATKIEALIETKKDIPVTVSVAGAVMTVTATDAGIPFKIYITVNGEAYTGTDAITTDAEDSKGHYKNLVKLKREFDKVPYQVPVESQAYPLQGATYKYYYWVIKRTEKDTGGMNVINTQHTVINTFEMWVNESLASLITQLDLIVP